jgi:hypothetical protein
MIDFPERICRRERALSQADYGCYVITACGAPDSKEQISMIGPGLIVNRNRWFYFINGYHEVDAEITNKGNKLALLVERTSSDLS